MIREDEKLVHSYSGPIGSAVGQVKELYNLIVDKQGFIAAANCNNNNVLLLSPSLTYVRELISAGRGLRKLPIRMHFIEKPRLLLVVGSSNGRPYSEVQYNRHSLGISFALQSHYAINSFSQHMTHIHRELLITPVIMSQLIARSS